MNQLFKSFFRACNFKKYCYSHYRLNEPSHSSSDDLYEKNEKRTELSQQCVLSRRGVVQAPSSMGELRYCKRWKPHRRETVVFCNARYHFLRAESSSYINMKSHSWVNTLLMSCFSVSLIWLDGISAFIITAVCNFEMEAPVISCFTKNVVWSLLSKRNLCEKQFVFLEMREGIRWS